MYYNYLVNLTNERYINGNYYTPFISIILKNKKDFKIFKEEYPTLEIIKRLNKYDGCFCKNDDIYNIELKHLKDFLNHEKYYIDNDYINTYKKWLIRFNRNDDLGLLHDKN